MLLERKRRGASSSVGMFSKPHGCRMWGKCEMQHCSQIPQHRAGGCSVGPALVCGCFLWRTGWPGAVGALTSHGALSVSTFTAGERGVHWLGFGQSKR